MLSICISLHAFCLLMTLHCVFYVHAYSTMCFCQISTNACLSRTCVRMVTVLTWRVHSCVTVTWASFPTTTRRAVEVGRSLCLMRKQSFHYSPEKHPDWVWSPGTQIQGSKNILRCICICFDEIKLFPL